ncbi:MAG: biotin--[acetyl-CoA-carboxylase] ligase [Rubricella sp.]
MSLALFDALDALTGRGDLMALKWPNDVLMEGRKIAGILLESRDGLLVIGVGVNLVAHPPQEMLEEHALPAANLLERTGMRIVPDALFDELAAAFARWDALLEAEGFAPVREAWLARAANRGAVVTARMPGRTVSGRFEGIDDTGAIVIDTGQGRQAIPAADIFF